MNTSRSEESYSVMTYSLMVFFLFILNNIFVLKIDSIITIISVELRSTALRGVRV